MHKILAITWIMLYFPSILRFYLYRQQFSSGLLATLLQPDLLCFQVARQIEGDTFSFHMGYVFLPQVCFDPASLNHELLYIPR